MLRSRAHLNPEELQEPHKQFYVHILQLSWVLGSMLVVCLVLKEHVFGFDQL